MKEKAERDSERYGRKVCQFGFSVLIAQWVGIYYGTFVLYGWDEMEPISYMVGVSWAVLGYGYFLRNKTEFGITTFKHITSQKRLQKLIKRRNIDYKRIELLEKNIEIIKRKMEMTKGFN